MQLIKREHITSVFFDCSLHGILVKKLKKIGVKVIVNYHNNESNYYYDMYKLKGVPYYLVYRVARRNEILSSKYGDFHVFISQEDCDSIKYNGKSVVIPVTLKDKNDLKAYKIQDEYVLFLGSAFFANIEAANYIISNLAPFINKRIRIVGKGMKEIFKETYDNVDIYDYVEDLQELMYGAEAFISPIFSGSGAKIKIAEALMYGKKIIGTECSFFGYKIKDMDAIVCKNDNDFINCINKLSSTDRFSERNRQLFETVYSDKNNSEYYKSVLNYIEQNTL